MDGAVPISLKFFRRKINAYFNGQLWLASFHTNSGNSKLCGIVSPFMGAGNVGLAAAMAARIVNCDPIIVVDVMPERLALALELGATHVIDASKDGLVEAVRRIRPAGVAYALESTGNPGVLRAAFEILHTRGICGLIGGSKIGTEANLDMTHLLFGRTVRGILQGDSKPKKFLPQLVKLFGDGLFPVDRLVKHYPLEQIETAISDMKSGRTIKPVLLMH